MQQLIQRMKRRPRLRAPQMTPPRSGRLRESSQPATESIFWTGHFQTRQAVRTDTGESTLRQQLCCRPPTNWTWFSLGGLSMNCKDTVTRSHLQHHGPGLVKYSGPESMTSMVVLQFTECCNQAHGCVRLLWKRGKGLTKCTQLILLYVHTHRREPTAV